jgi:hypothetical protein
MIAGGVKRHLVDAVREQKQPGACGERGQGSRSGRVPPGQQTDASAERPQARPEVTSKILAHAQRVCIQKRPLDSRPQDTARLELCPTLGAAFEMTQHFMVGFHEQLLAQKRIGKIANLTALHGRSAFG